MNHLILLRNIVVFSGLMSLSALLAQENGITREFDAVVLSGDVLSELSGAPIEELAMYSYDVSAQAWVQVTFQVDEKNANNVYVLKDSVDDVAGLDANDEVVFLAKSLGGKNDNWPEGIEGSRYEIQVTDSAAAGSPQSGWAYLFRIAGGAPNSPDDYVIYTPSQDKGKDFVEGLSYRIGGQDNGLFNSLSIPASSGVDLLDRQKLRGTTSFFLLPSINEDLFEFKSVAYKDGTIRVIRRLSVALPEDILELPVEVQFYPNYVVFGADLTIPSDLSVSGIDIKILSIRHSLDLSAAASGMLFSSANNTGITVDASSDQIDAAIEASPEVNYTHISGSQSTIITLFSVPGDVGDQQSLYYLDQMQSGNPDPDDNNAYGDSGVLITGADIEGRLTIALKLFMLEGNQPQSLAEALVAQEESPLGVSTTFQEFVTSVAGNQKLPEGFALAQNYPNPFNPATQISYSIPAGATQVRLVVYDLLGHSVRTLVNGRMEPGTYSVSWNGLNDKGRAVSSGVYIYRLEHGDQATSRKMLFVK